MNINSKLGQIMPQRPVFKLSCGTCMNVTLSLIVVILSALVFFHTLSALNIFNSSSYYHIDPDCYVIYHTGWNPDPVPEDGQGDTYTTPKPDPKPDQSEPDQPKTDQPKPDQPKPNQPKTDQPKRVDSTQFPGKPSDMTPPATTTYYPYLWRGPLPMKPDGWMCLLGALLGCVGGILSIIGYFKVDGGLRLRVASILCWGFAGGMGVGALWSVDDTIINNGGSPSNKWTFDPICDGIPESWYSLSFWLIFWSWALICASIGLIISTYMLKSGPNQNGTETLDEETPLLLYPQRSNGLTINLLTINK